MNHSVYWNGFECCSVGHLPCEKGDPSVSLTLPNDLRLRLQRMQEVARRFNMFLACEICLLKWGFPKMVGFPKNYGKMGFPTKNDHFWGVLGGNRPT